MLPVLGGRGSKRPSKITSKVANLDLPTLRSNYIVILLFVYICIFSNYYFEYYCEYISDLTMSSRIKVGGVWHPLNIIDISTSEEEVEAVEKVEKVIYCNIL